MDLSFLYKAYCTYDKVLQLSPEYRNREETLYYDETDNYKHVRIKENGELNIKTDACFVLGGIQAGNAISAVEMNGELLKKKELKAVQDLKGDFLAIMRNQKVDHFLRLVYSRRWCFHFFMVQPIYYSFVDIVDSLCDYEEFTLEHKSLLYHIMIYDFDSSITILKKYKYPNIKDKDVVSFLDELTIIIENYSRLPKIDVYEGNAINDLLFSINEVKNGNKELTFLCNEESHLWVNSFSWFYRKEIASFPAKKLIFDQEDQVEDSLRKDPIVVNGTNLSNYSFVKSSEEPMIQLSDYVVAILKKYFVFLDRDFDMIEKDILGFDRDQLSNFMLLNSILLYSKEYNPLFHNYISSHRIPEYVNYYMTQFGM